MSFKPSQQELATAAADELAIIKAERDRLAAELATLKRLAPLCDKCGSGTGTRSGCPYCALARQSAALSEIDYLCGAPNEMHVSLYEVDRNEVRVIKAVATLRDAVNDLSEGYALSGYADRIRHQGDKINEQQKEIERLKKEIDDRDNTAWEKYEQK